MLRAIIFIAVLLFPIRLYGQDSNALFQNVESSFTYTGDIFANISGGLETGVRYMDNIDVKVGFDIKEFSFYFYGLGNQGESISEIVGDVQTLSNIDTDNSWRLYEVWFEKNLPALRSSFLFGLYNLNSEFDVANTGGIFLNSSHGIGPDFSSSGITAPSIFPLTSIAARLKINLFKGAVLKFALLDAVPSNPDNTKGTSVYLRESEGALLVSEFSFSKQDDGLLERGINNNTPYRFVFGGWKYTVERIGWLGESESDHGVYSIAEVSLPNGVSIFTRAGAVNRDINRYNYYVGTGFNYTGFIKNRSNDMIGLALSFPVNSDDFILAEERNGNDFSRSESTIEFTYLFVVSDNVSFQFDSQYIQNPNQTPEIENAFVIGLRSVFSF